MRKTHLSIVIRSLALSMSIGAAGFSAGDGQSADHRVRDVSALRRRPPSVHVKFGLDARENGIFPTDFFTVPDAPMKTGLRINLPLRDCTVHVTDCLDHAHVNALDGFNMQPRVTVPFDGDIDPNTVTSQTMFFVEVGDADVDAGPEWRRWRHRREAVPVIGINQAVWDPASRVVAVQSDEQLKQHTRYAFVVTNRVLDARGAPVRAAAGLFPDDDEHDHDTCDENAPDPYREALQHALHAVKRATHIHKRDIAGLSVFTTQSATAVLEHIRDELKAATPDSASFLLATDGSRTVFPFSSVTGINAQQQTKVSPPTFQSFNVPLARISQYSAVSVGHLAFGSYRSPRYLSLGEPFMPPVGTRAGTPPVTRVDTLYFNLWLPAGTSPAGGWPIAIFGLGGSDIKEDLPWYFAAALASQGIAMISINNVGHAYGPLSALKVTLSSGAVVQLPAGGRSEDLNGDNTYGVSEGISTISADNKIIGARDALRQLHIDFMQLVRVIEAGMDVDGDLIADLDASKIYYYGVSFGAGYGHTFLALEPSLKAGVLASPGGLNSRADLQRMRPANRPLSGVDLASRIPSLLNSPGLTSIGEIPVTAPFFDESIPLRNQPVLTNPAAGAMEIQRYFDHIAWVTHSGDGTAHAPHIRKSPLAGNLAKPLLIQVQKGDLTAPNPRSTQFVRAGGNADITTFYLNDLAFAEDTTVNKNPHVFMTRYASPGLSGPLARANLVQTASFLASGGTMVVQSQPARFFEVPIVIVPEDYWFIQ